MVQNDKKFCLSHSLSQEPYPYIIGLSFLVLMCKIIISLDVCLMFSKLWFFGLLWGGGVKKAKNGPKRQKVLSVMLHISYAYIIWNYASYDSYLWYTYVKWSSLLAFFLFFQNFDILGCFWFQFCFWYLFLILIFWVGGKSAKNCPKWQKILSITFHISGTIHHIWLSCMVHLCKVIISPGSFFIFQNFDFSGC